MNEISVGQKIRAIIQNQGNTEFFDDFEYKTLFLNNIFADPSNPRYLPVLIIDDKHATELTNRKITKRTLVKIYDAEDVILLGKGCMVNSLKYGSKEWKLANSTIMSVIDLAQNINVSELIQAPTVYPKDSGFMVLTGHRRFFALIFSKGKEAACQFKVYKNEPILKKVKQFQENSSREALPQIGKLYAFDQAMVEANEISNQRKLAGLKKMSVRETAHLLGISMGAFDNYNVLVRYPCVFKYYESGMSSPFVKVKKIVIHVENEYKERSGKSVLNIEDKRAINRLIDKALIGGKISKENNIAQFSFPKINSEDALRKLLTENVFELDTGIDWESVDWQSSEDVNTTLKKLIDSFSLSNQSNRIL